MIVYPDIELQNGKLVNLLRGRKDAPVVYDLDPLEAVQQCVGQGAEWLHVVDLDAVFGDGSNAGLIETIIRKAGVPVQVAGAIRSIDAVRGWIDAGAGRVVIATAAVKNPAFVRQAAFAYPDQVVVSIDARGGYVVAEGWTETTSFTPAEFAAQYDDLPLAAFIFTDVDADADEPAASISHTEALAEAVRSPVIASGVVKSLDDISTLNFMPNIAGAITGRAIFGGTFDLADAIAITHEPPLPVAPFA